MRPSSPRCQARPEGQAVKSATLAGPGVAGSRHFTAPSSRARPTHQSRFRVAVLDGTDVDSGTAAEIGYAFARGKLIVGYRGDFRLSADNEGSTVNLQVEYFIRASGGTIVERYEDLGPALGALGGARRSGTRARPAGPGRRSARRRRVR